MRRGTHHFTISVEASAKEAAIPAAPIVILADSTIVGAPLADTVGSVGDSVRYSYAAATGYTNVHVRIDGRAAPSTGAIMADTAPHVVTITADRLLTVPQAAEGLFSAAQAVLTAADVPAAFQAYLDSAYAYAQRTTDLAAAQRDIATVDALAFDFLDDEAALRRVDAALAGYSFRIGPDALGDPGGTPILNPGDTGVVSFLKRAPVPSASVSPTAILTDTIEPTVFLYVNGILTEQFDASLTMAHLHSLIRKIPGFESSNIAYRLFYNRTWGAQAPTPEQHRMDCVQFFGARLAGGTIGANSFPDFMAQCMRDSTLRDLSDADIVEAIRQVISILANSSAQEVDAARLGNDIQRYRRLGRHVILVPHSQGNLMANQAIHFLKQHNLYHGRLDSACIGVVSLASPVSARWDVPTHYLAPVVVDGDMVPSIGGNTWPRTSTELSRSVDLRAKALDAVGVVGKLYRLWQGFTTLHYVNTSYLRYEAADAVVAGAEQVYGACAVHDMLPSQASVSTTTGSRFGVFLTFTNAFGDTIARTLRADQWSSSDSSVALPTGPGIFQALEPGTATVTATRGTRTAATRVIVTDPLLPRIVGQWSGTWYSETDTSGYGTMQVTIRGNTFSMEAEVTWTDKAGVVWHAYSSSDPTNRITDLPGVASGASFWAVYKKPTEPNGFDFYRHFDLSTLPSTGIDIATGTSSDGSGIDTWHIQLTRVQ
ncbi:MAG: hypothetical protein IRY91_14590 [Gemmatimonadaceae bacterium]|nr:hypothetical protein [Gemmatimonadaceae bacterium]